MKRLVLLLTVLVIFGFGCTQKEVAESGEYHLSEVFTARLNTDLPLQVGVNFIKLAEDHGIAERMQDPEWVINDAENLGAQMLRQVAGAGLYWRDVEPANDQWDFEDSDEFYGAATQLQRVGDLYAMSFASPTPPWSDQWAELENQDHVNYLERTINRYQSAVEYWEPGNELSLWRVTEEYSAGALPELFSDFVDKVGAWPPSNSFSTKDKADFLDFAAAMIHELDPEAKVIYPGLVGTGEDVQRQFGEILRLTDPEAFDIYNYHDYGPWWELAENNAELQKVIELYGNPELPVWVTETGVTSDASLDIRTDYPNSPDEQAADVFRRFAILFAHGVDYVAWHTQVSSPPVETNNWRDYGLTGSTGMQKPAYFTYQLFANLIVPFDRAEVVQEGDYESEVGVWAYRFVSGDEEKYVIWSPFESQYVLETKKSHARVIQVVPRLERGEPYFTIEIVESRNGLVEIPISNYPVLVEQF